MTDNARRVVFIGEDERLGASLRALCEVVSVSESIVPFESLAGRDAPALCSLAARCPDLVFVQALGSDDWKPRPQGAENAPLCVAIVDDDLAGENSLTHGLDDYVLEAELNAASLRRLLRHAQQLKSAHGEAEQCRERHEAFLQNSSEGIFHFVVEPPLPIDWPIEQQIEESFARCLLADCNEALARMYGFESAQAMVGARLNDYLPPTAENCAYIRRFIEAGYRISEAESQEKDREGRVCYFLNSLTGVVKEGHLCDVWGTQRDVTERKSIDRAQAQLAAIVESSNDAILSAASDGAIITSWNRAAEELLGYTAAEMIGQPISSLIPEDRLDEVNTLYQRALRGEASRVQTVRRHKDGHLVDVLVVTSPIYDADRDICGVSALLHDLSEKKQLSAARDRLFSVLEAMPQMVAMADPQLRLLQINRGGARMLGAEDGAFPCDTLLHFHPPRLRDRYLQEMIPLALREGSWSGESLLQTADGRELPIYHTIIACKDASGDVECLASVATDISKEKQTQVALSNSEVFSMAVLDSVLSHIAVLDASGTITMVNQPWRRFVEENKKPGSILNSTFVGANYLEVCRNSAALVDSRDAQEAQMAYEGICKVLEGRESSFSMEYACHSANKRRWFLMTVTPLGVAGGGAVVAHTNITKRRLAEEALRASEERLRNAQAMAQMGDWTYYLDKDELWGSEEANRICNWNDGPHSAQELAALVHRDELQEMLGVWVAAQQEGLPYEVEHRMIVDGIEKWVHVKAVPQQDQTGRVTCIAGVTQDITERKQSQLALENERARLRTLVQTIPDLIWLKDLDGVYLACNPRFEQFFGASEAEILGKSDHDFIDEPLAESFRNHDRLALAAGCPTVNEEWVTFRSDGHRELLETIKTPLRDKAGNLIGVLGIARNITVMRRAEEAREAQRRRLTMLAEVARRLLTSDSPSELMEGIFTELAAILDTECYFNYMVAPEGRTLVLQSCAGLTAAERASMERLAFGEMLCGTVAATRQPVVIEDASHSAHPEIRALKALGCLCYAGYPLIARGRLLGILGFASRTRLRYTEEELRLIEAVCDMVASSVERVRLLDELSESQEQLRTAVESGNIGIWDWSEGNGVKYSPQWARQLGYEPAEITGGGDECDKRLHPDDFQGVMQRREKLLHSPAMIYRDEFRLRHKDGSYRWILSQGTVSRNDDGSVSRILGSHVDITDIKDAEAALQKAHAELEQRVRERTAELEQANRSLHEEIIERQMAVNTLREVVAQIEQARSRADEALESTKMARAEAEAAREDAERANRAKSEFLSRMSHELRTPMNSILGFAQIMEMNASDEREIERVSYILKAGQHLLQLINEVLDMARIESGRLSVAPEPVSVRLTIRNAVQMIHPLCAQRGLSVSLPEGESDNLFVYADPQRFSQVLLNLLSNATKYNSPNGQVRIACEPRDAMLRISVSDTGQGIDAAKVSRLFQPFERLGAESSGVEGTGLGLSFSKGLMEAMHGTIGVHSEVGVGSTFWIELPLSDGRAAASHATLADWEWPALNGTRSVLYIEDNAANMEVVEHVLKEHKNLRLLSAMQGGLGIELAREHRPALILLDLHLPDIPGEEVMRRLLADEATCNCPIVIVSADATPSQIRRLLTNGAADFLTKPLDLRRFLSVVHEFLQ